MIDEPYSILQFYNFLPYGIINFLVFSSMAFSLSYLITFSQLLLMSSRHIKIIYIFLNKSLHQTWSHLICSRSATQILFGEFLFTVIWEISSLSLMLKAGFLDPKTLGFFLSFFFFVFSRATPIAYRGFQARSLMGAVASGLHHSHSNARSELHLRPTPQLMAMLDP